MLISIKASVKGKPLYKRTFALVFGEMFLNPQLGNNPVWDNVCGFEDFGQIGRSQKLQIKPLYL